MKKLSLTVLVLSPLSLIVLGPGCADKGDAAQVVTGLVDATEVDVASKIPGRVSEMRVKEGDRVQEGQLLLKIESEEITAKIAQVEAGLDAARAKLKLAEIGARPEEKAAAREALDAAEHQSGIAQKMYDRVASLFEKGAASQAQLDDAQFKRDTSNDQRAMAQAKRDMVDNGARPEEIDGLGALVKQAEGTLQEVASYDKETTQVAPIAGEVSKIILHRGELAATGYPILTIVDTADVWATFAVREDLLAAVKKGQRIEAEVPALGRTATFEVFNISALGDFATWRATSEKNSFDLKTFEVKARPVAPLEGLRPGMTVRWRVR